MGKPLTGVKRVYIYYETVGQVSEGCGIMENGNGTIWNEGMRNEMCTATSPKVGDGRCKGTFPYDSDLRPPPVSSDVHTHFTIISSFIYLLLFTFFSDISDLRRCRGTYSIPLILIPYCTIPILHDSITFSDLP